MKKLLLFIFLLLPIQSVVAEELNLIPPKVDIVDLVPITIVDKIEEKLVAYSDDKLLIAMGLIAGGGVGATGGGQSYLAQSDFEDESDDSQWIDDGGTGTWDDDYTTTILEGSESLHEEDEYRHLSFSGTDDEIYFAAIVQINSSSSATIMKLEDSGSNELVDLQTTWDTDHHNIRLLDSVSSELLSCTAGDGIGNGTVVYYKITFNNDVSNATGGVYYNIGQPFSSWTECGTFSGESISAQAAQAEFYGNRDTVYDDARVNTTAGGGDTY